MRMKVWSGLLLPLLFNGLLVESALASTKASGKATVYSNRFQGRRTATRERFSQRAMTAASPTLPLGSKVLVENKRSGRSAIVKINDREKSGGGRLVDLSKAAANKVGVKGTAPVTTKVVSRK